MALHDWLLSRARVSSRPHQRVRTDDKMAFFQQLATLLGSGTPLLQALRICAQESQSLRLQRVLLDIAARVAAGSSLHAATAQQDDIFEPYWVEVIRTGEITGQMGKVLLELNRQIREAREVRRKLTGALVYPAILFVVAVVALGIMLGFVVPTFAAMFDEMGARLPAMTQLVVDASHWLVGYGGYLLLAGAVGVVLGRRYLRTETGRRTVEGLGLVVPLVGDCLVQSAMYRLASNLALLLHSGIPMLEALTALEEIFQRRPVYRDALRQVIRRVAGGSPLAAAMEETGLFTTMLTNSVRVGEESGQLAVVMEQVAPYYRDKMEGLVTKVSKLLEPVIIIVMGAAVGGVMLAIYLPMFEMAGKVH
jgi:type IV pilus assembly protein PilC